MADLPAPLTSFPQFTRLPRELRDKIWHLCLPPRRLEILETGSMWIHRNRLDIILTLPITLPLISRVCRESYEEARRCFQYNGGRPMKVERPYHPVYDDPKPRKQESGRLWFDRDTDMICIDANPIHPQYFRPRNDNNNNNNNDNTDDRGIAPELRELLSDPNAHLCIDYCLIRIGRPLPHGTGLPGNFVWKYKFVEWALQYITKRKTCAVVIGRADTRMSYQEACESGLFGPFAEAQVVHIDVDDDIQNPKLQALEKFGSMVPLVESWNLRDYIRSHYVRQDKSRFLKDIRLLWLQKEKLLPRNLESIGVPLSTEAALSVERLPKFNFVIAVHLSIISGNRPFTGHVDMGILQIAKAGTL
ncbi:hypothetical protein F4679DRAFT_229817 [Xylaria curta]|nr:hypothetical protein F4679DRAFT_229817 [Xylaria curta]